MYTSIFLRTFMEEQSRNIVSHHISSTDFEMPKEILFLEENTLLEGSAIYIGNKRQVFDHLSSIPKATQCVYFIYHDSSCPSFKLPRCHDVCYIETSLPFSTLYNCIVSYTAEYQSRAVNHHVISDVFQELFSKETLDSFQLLHFLEALPVPLNDYTSLLVIHFDQEQYENRIDELVNHLQTALPTSNIGTHNNYIVILWSGDSFTFAPPDYVLDIFEPLLQEFNAHMVVTTSIRRYENIPHIYQMVLLLFDIIHLVPTIKGKRIVEMHRTNIYLAAYLCYKKCISDYNADFYQYLIHLDILNLYHYDLDNNSMLEETLITYLTNGMGMNETAQSLNIHRNTLVYRLKKIKSILKDDMNDPVIRTKYIFSHILLEFGKEN